MYFKTKNNYYLYSKNKILLLHPILYGLIKNKGNINKVKEWTKKNDHDLKNLKFHILNYNLFKDKGLLKPLEKKDFFLFDEKIIKNNLYMNNHLVFEVTDDCNLNCKYCGYGYFYEKKENRGHRRLPIKKAYLLIDYMTQVWNTNRTNNYKNNVFIGFYGGEPLMNINFIKKVVLYLKSIQERTNITFTYLLTTNGVYLNKHIDYFKKNNFRINLSLDGNKENNSYRVFHNGQHSYDIVKQNINKIKQKYPDYFQNNINFLSVLHNRNSVEELYTYFKNEGKKVKWSEISTINIDEKKKQEFNTLFKSIKDSIKCTSLINKIEKDLFVDTPVGNLLTHSVFSYFKDIKKNFIDIFKKNENDLNYSGTCSPLSRRIFLSVDGKIYPCEKVSRDNYVGEVTEKDIIIDFNISAKNLNKSIQNFKNQCSTCYNTFKCTKCFYLFNSMALKDKCSQYLSKNDFKKKMSKIMLSFEEKPDLLNKITHEIFYS